MNKVANKIIEIRKKIEEALPQGRVIPRHSDKGHFYEVIDGQFVTPPIYSSVTTKLAQLKDESLMNYKMNCVIRYVFSNWQNFTEINIMEHIGKAESVPQQNLEDAGGIGTEIHNHREKIFKEWISTGIKPIDFVSYIPEVQRDVRAISAIRALEKFVNDYDYTPIACELFVYDHKMRVAGTLDDLGMMKYFIRKGNKDCEHEMICNEKTDKYTCLKCDMQYKYEFTLLDLKSSNQLKDHYFYQVSMYWDMFRKLVGITPERCLILQVSKEKGTYKIEDLKRPAKLAQYSKHMIKVDEGTQFIKKLRKDNQRNVAPLLKL